MFSFISILAAIFALNHPALALEMGGPGPAGQPRVLTREEARERAARDAAVMVEDMKRRLRPVPRFRAEMEIINLDDLSDRGLRNQQLVLEGSLQHVEQGIELSLSFNGLNGQTYRIALDPQYNGVLNFTLVGPAGSFRPIEMKYGDAFLYLKFLRELELGGPSNKLPVEMRVALDFERSQVRVHALPAPDQIPALGALQTGRLEIGN